MLTRSVCKDCGYVEEHKDYGFDIDYNFSCDKCQDYNKKVEARKDILAEAQNISKELDITLEQAINILIIDAFRNRD